jgi:hypothetical protein
MCKTRLDTKIHPLACLRMQSSFQAGESSSTRRRCRSRGNPETHRRQRRRVRNPRELGDPLTGAAGRENSGKPGGLNLASGGCRSQGNLRTHRRRDWKRINGATRRFVRQERRRMEKRGNSKLHRWQAGRCRSQGNLRTHHRRDWKRINGATRRFARQKRRRMEKRGNSKLYRWQAGGCRSQGNLRTHHEADGTVHGPSNLRVRRIRTPEASVSGVFVFGRSNSTETPNAARRRHWRIARGWRS